MHVNTARLSRWRHVNIGAGRSWEAKIGIRVAQVADRQPNFPYLWKMQQLVMAGCRQPGGDFEETKREGDIREQVDDGIPHRSERFRIRDGNCELPIEWTPFRQRAIIWTSIEAEYWYTSWPRRGYRYFLIFSLLIVDIRNAIKKKNKESKMQYGISCRDILIIWCVKWKEIEI